MLFKSLFLFVCLVLGAQSAHTQCIYSLSTLYSDVPCFGGQGSIDLVVTGGVGPFTYAWSNGETGEDLGGLDAGTYTVTVSDAGGCTSTISQAIQSPSGPLSLVLNDDGIITCQNRFSDITPDISGGYVPYSFVWSTGTTDNVLPASAAGIYTVTISDAGGCTITASKTVQVSPSYPIADSGLPPNVSDVYISCATAPNILGGPLTSMGPDFRYQWTTFLGSFDPGVDSTQPFIEVTEFGDYSLEVFNIVEGCSNSTSLIFVTHTFPEFPIASIKTPAPLACFLTEVTLDATASSTGPQYSYQWTTTDGNIVSGGNTLTPVVDKVGTYVLEVTNNTEGCSKKRAVKVIDNQIITANAGPNTGLSCSTLLATLDGTGSSTGPEYAYQWSTTNGNIVAGQGTLTPVVDQAGLYTLTVTNILNGCSQTDSVKVYPGPAIPVQELFVLDVSCTGQLGIVGVDIVQGTAPNTYLWSDGSTDASIVNINIGTYSVTVTDATGCKFYAELEVKATSNLTLSAAVTDPSCNVPNSGAIDLTAVTVFAPVTYLWSTGSVNQDIGNLSAGTYTVTATYALGTCQEVLSVTLTNQGSFTLDAVATPANSCAGLFGSINLTVTGNTAPYTYAWSNGDTNEDPGSLNAGTYTVTVTDVTACSKTLEVVVGDTPSFILSTTTTPASCGAFNGAVNLTVTGNTAPYTFLWDTGASTEDISDVPPGDYDVTVMDILGCTQTTQATVGQSSNLNLSTQVTEASCTGLCTGAIDLTVSGGSLPYSYAWSNGSSNQNLDNLCSGPYTVTVTDGAGCTQTITVNVNQTPNLQLSTQLSLPLCFGQNAGAINLSVSGGTPAFSYVWNNSAATEDIGNLPAGTYTVTVSDANGCTQTTSAEITQPAQIQATATMVQVACFGGVGSIEINVSGGGLAPYAFLWPNGETTQTAIGLFSGSNCATITDAQGCSIVECGIITEDPPLSFTITSLSNDCVSETLSGPSLPGATYQWSGDNNFTATTANITTFVAGVYELLVTNANGCTGTNTYTVNLSGAGNCGALKGLVFQDEDESCTFNLGEKGLAGWLVRAEGSSDTLYGVTNAAGQYLVGVPLGTYTMKVLVPNGLWNVCAGGTPVSVGMSGDTLSGGDFPVQAIYFCPAMTVSIGTDKLRRCFAGNYYQVEYCNQGTETAQDAYITIVLDQYLSALSASIPYTDQGSNVLKFELGDVAVGECGAFNIEVFVQCNAVLGQTHCTQAAIYPDTLCAPANANWTRASLQVSSICNPDSLRFSIGNVGKGAMGNSTNYIVVEDGIMFRSGILSPLDENETMEIAVPANGSTWRVEVGQEAFHPYPAPVGLSVEGCTTSAAFSTGFVNQFTTPDEPSAVDIDCTTNKGSFDPNDKHSYPVGYGADHYVRPGTDIEYLIRFQNTGTDTAFTVQIVDTLSSWLDPASIRFGTSSHAYRYDLNGEGVVHFIFDHILLPDSNTNEAASHGFAKFNIKPRLDAPLEARIENDAAIYFDFNDPVFTNTTFLRLGENFVTVGLWQPFVPEAQVIAMPNPFLESTFLEVKGLSNTRDLRLQVLDLRGNVLREMESGTEFFQLKREAWPAGVYLFRITQQGRLVGTGKLVAE